MRNTSFLFITALLSPTGIWAQFQTSAFDFRAIAKPGVTVGSHNFTTYTTISGAALNDAGEVAFAAQYGDSPSPDNAGVFTSKRIVARQGDAVGGKYIVLIPIDTVLAINNAGQVAFEAWYADTREIAGAGEASGLGIFVENRLAMSPAPDSSNVLPAFTLTEDGQVLLKETTRQVSAPAQAPKAPGILGRVRIKPPGGLPISIALGPARQSRPPIHGAAPPEGTHPAAQLFPMNHGGQILIPVNFKDGGFLLLLGTPAAH